MKEEMVNKTMLDASARGDTNRRPGDEASGRTGELDAVLGRIDQYELLKELGTGGFGSVYLARDTVSRILVAVKGLPALVKNCSEEMARVQENFALVSRLHHPHIAAALVLHPANRVEYTEPTVAAKLNVKPGNTLMVMEFAPGVTLSKWRQQFPDRKVPLEQAIEVVRQIADALDYAHERNIIHRDIKPTNVEVETSLDGTFTVRVLDFGLAAEVRSSMNRVSMEVTGTSGTRQYMAPEQWAGRKQSSATDQYALAALFYELVTGEVPFASAFESDDPIVMMMAVTTQAPEIPSDLPSCVRKALARGLAKQPLERSASCGDFISELRGRGCSRIKKGMLLSLCSVLVALGVLGTLKFADWGNEQRQALQELELLEVKAGQAYANVTNENYISHSELKTLCQNLEASYLAGKAARKRGDSESAKRRFLEVRDFSYLLKSNSVVLASTQDRPSEQKEVLKGQVDVKGLSWSYIISNGVASVGLVSPDTTTIPQTSAGLVIVPSEIKGYPVAEIGKFAFKGCTKIRSVVIPERVVSIGEAAFRECSSVEEVVIPNSTKLISKEAFYGCTALRTVEIPTSVTNIEDGVFAHCDEIKSLVIPGSVVRIGSDAFKECSAIESVKIEEGVKEIGSGAFQNCQQLTVITLPSTVCTIESDIFLGCQKLKSANLTTGISQIGCRMFKDCKSLDSIVFPPSIVSIGYGAFEGCDQLKSVTLPLKLKKIDSSVFSHCSGLESVTIPSDVESVGDFAFFRCTSLRSINMPRSVKQIGYLAFCDCQGLGDGMIVVDGVLLAINGQFLFTKKIVLPKNVRLIANGLFCYSLEGLNEIVIDEDNPYFSFKNGMLFDKGLKKLIFCAGKTAFITVPDGVEIIAPYAFAGSRQLRTVSLPNGVKYIAHSAFAGCSRLVSINVPESVEEIAAHAFYSCAQLRTVSLSSRIRDLQGSTFSGCENLETITIPNSVTNIAGLVFYKCEKLKTVNLNKGDTKRMRELLRKSDINVARVKFVEHENLAKTLGTEPDSGHANVERVERKYQFLVSDNQVSLGGGSAESTAIPTNSTGFVDIPSKLNGHSVVKIDDYAFCSCEEIVGVSIPLGVETIGTSAFMACRKMSSVSIPKSVTTIGVWAFSSCGSLKSVVIPPGVVTIGKRAFCSCGKLESVAIPSTVKNIGLNAFYWCDNLKTIQVEVGDTERVKRLLKATMMDVSTLTFIER